jgi:hypothetical protein
LNKVLSLFKFKKELELEFNLEPAKDFMETYIGVAIIGFETYHEDVEDLNDDVFGKIVVAVSVEGDSLLLKLNSLNGKPAGMLELAPSTKGQFAENTDGPIWASRYRIVFFGGDFFEYIDHAFEGSLHFHP